MSNRTNFGATRNATFSLASVSGLTRCEPPDGVTTDPYGPGRARVSLSARQALELGLTTSGTSGQLGSGSLRSADLQSSLESRLRAALRTTGPTLYALIWKPWTTPSGRSRSRLRASVLRTSATGFTGWPTPSSMDWKGADRLTRPAGGDDLPTRATRCLAGWATPAARDYRFANALPWSERGGGTKGGAAQQHGGASDPARHSGPTDGYWRDADWLLCWDGRWRPVEPGAFPLAHGAAARVGRLRAYGNAIAAPAAEAFIRAYMST